MGIENLAFVLQTTGDWCQSDGAEQIQTIISTIVNLIKIVIPIALVILGMLDLGKAVMSQKEDDIKKGQSTFLKRLIAAVVVFLVFFVVQIVLNFIVPKESPEQGHLSLMQCVTKFINGPNSVSDTNNGTGTGGTGNTDGTSDLNSN